MVSDDEGSSSEERSAGTGESGAPGSVSLPIGSWMLPSREPPSRARKRLRTAPVILH